jgi:DNA (cytosine-5)-methyltransferase 1
MSLGLARAGFDVALAFDNDEYAVRTHCHNLGNRCILADATRLSGKAVLRRAGVERGDLALFAGGPPCQGFSKQKRGAHLGDDRNLLIREYIRLVQETRPRFFVFENVAIFGQKRGRDHLSHMFDSLADYAIYPGFYNCADYGLAQTRERFVAVGGRKDQRASFRRPPPTVAEWKTVGEVLSGLPEPPEDYTDHPDYPNHQRARVTEVNVRRFAHVPQGGGWQDIPEELRLRCHRNVDTSSGGWPDVYGRLWWDGQCPTITGGFDSFTRGRYGHPVAHRPLTPREAARLQGFPDTFVFLGTRADIRSQIGNAVPPPLAEAVAREILRSLLTADGLLAE